MRPAKDDKLIKLAVDVTGSDAWRRRATRLERSGGEPPYRHQSHYRQMSPLLYSREGTVEKRSQDRRLDQGVSQTFRGSGAVLPVCPVQRPFEMAGGHLKLIDKP
jgi:hypothetical protein